MGVWLLQRPRIIQPELALEVGVQTLRLAFSTGDQWLVAVLQTHLDIPNVIVNYPQDGWVVEVLPVDVMQRQFAVERP